MRLQPTDAKWLVPMGGIATGLFVTDPSSSFGMASYHAQTYNTASNAGLAAAAGLSGSAYLWGRITKNERMRETGVLATEAMIDVLGLQYALQYSTGRLTPIQSNYQNIFFRGGTSFPSNHAALTWAFASVVAQEYPNPFAQIGAYGLATGVSLARVAAGQHFLSDVLIGGLIGYQVGRHIYRTRHNANLDDLPVETAPNPERLGSTYIPLDSWIYPAMYRLISRDYIDTAYMGLRPWTRMNCARMLANLDEEIEGNPTLPSDISETMKYLHAEFADELSAIEGKPIESIELSSVYTRITGIAGQPLNDNNLGQTIVNDYGRPYQQGVNNSTGFTARAEDGRFAFYVDGEYQHAPSAPAYPLLTRQVIAFVNQDPLQPATPFPTIDQFRLLDTYVTARFLGQDISVGKQSLDWGPTQSGSMAMSNNAEPFWMLRINQTEPLWVPGVSRLFGPFRFDNFFGQLSGHTQFPQGPYMYGQKFSFKPFAEIEVGTHNKKRPSSLPSQDTTRSGVTRSMRNVFGGVLGARYVWPKNIMFHCYCLSIWWPYTMFQLWKSGTRSVASWRAWEQSRSAPVEGFSPSAGTNWRREGGDVARPRELSRRRSSCGMSKLLRLLGFSQGTATKSHRWLFQGTGDSWSRVASPGVYRSKRIEHGCFGLFQFRDCEGRGATGRLALLFFGHRKRFLSTASRVSCSPKLSANGPCRHRISSPSKERSRVVKANVFYRVRKSSCQQKLTFRLLTVFAV